MPETLKPTEPDFVLAAREYVAKKLLDENLREYCRMKGFKLELMRDLLETAHMAGVNWQLGRD